MVLLLEINFKQRVAENKNFLVSREKRTDIVSKADIVFSVRDMKSKIKVQLSLPVVVTMK